MDEIRISLTDGGQTNREAFTPICSDFSGQSDGTVTCIAYPAQGMKGTNFQAAAFSLSELKAATTQAECLKVEEPPPHVGRARRETVNGVTFTVIEADGVATGNLINGYVYRSFHRDKCYELEVRIAFSNPANADLGTMKNFDLAVVHHRLKQGLSAGRRHDAVHPQVFHQLTVVIGDVPHRGGQG